MLKKYLKWLEGNYGYIFLLCAVITSITISILTLPFNIDSLYDEGYHFLSVKQALDGTIKGYSQWANILAAFLGPKICGSVLSLRIASLVLSLATALMFFLITHRAAHSLKDKTKYLLMVLFMCIPALGGIMISYNEISQFLLIVACATLYRLCTDTNKAKNIGWATTTGFLTGLALFSILPSAIILGTCAIMLTGIKYRKKWTELIVYLAGMALGLGLALLTFHLVVADLSVVFKQMANAAQSITTLNRGYDPLSFIVKICLFARDFALCTLIIIGIFSLGHALSKWSKLIAIIVYISCLLLYSFYQERPNVSTSMLMALLWLQPIIEDAAIQEHVKIKGIFTFKNVLAVFLILFPILASIGTNVYIGNKISFFLLPWALLLWLVDFDGKAILLRNGGMAAISIILLLSTHNLTRTIDYSQHKIDSGCFSEMYLTPAQYEHFSIVDSIVSHYGFRKNESVVFATQLSSVTLSYLEGKPCGIYFQPMDFVAQATEKTPIPDFLFLCKYDEDIAADKIKELGWGWPDEFDKYYIGSPDELDVGYSTERWLYCRRKQNQKKYANAQE